MVYDIDLMRIFSSVKSNCAIKRAPDPFAEMLAMKKPAPKSQRGQRKNDAPPPAQGQGRFFGNAIWYTLGGFTLQGIGFLASLFFAGVLGTEGLGYITNYVFWQTIFTVLISCQLNATVNNAAIKFGHDRLDEYLFTILRACAVPLGALLIFTALFPGAAAAVTVLSPNHMIICIFNAAFIAIVNVAAFAYITLGKKFQYLALTMSSALLSTGLSVVLVLYFRNHPLAGTPADGRIWGYTLGFLPVAAYALLMMIKRRGTHRKGYIKFALPLALPLIAHELAQVILGRSSSNILLRLSGPDSAGIYGLANTLGSVGIIAAAAFNGAWTPWYFRASSEGDTESVNIMMKKYIFVFAAFICGAMCVLPEAIRWFFGEDFAPGTRCLPFVLMCGFLLSMYNAVANYQIFREKTYYISIVSIGMGLLNLALNLVLIPKIGILGAALASLVCYLLQLFAGIIIGKFVIKGLNIAVRNILFGVAAVAVFMIFVYIFDSLWIIRWLAGLTCAAGLVWRGKALLAARN